MNTFILIALAWVFIGIFYESKYKYRIIKKGIYQEWSMELIAERACERKSHFLFGPICFILYCLDFDSNREGYYNPFESKQKLLIKLESGWKPKSLLCWLGIHDYVYRRSVFNSVLRQGKLPRENYLHTTEYCSYCPACRSISAVTHTLAVNDDFVLLKSKTLDDNIVKRIYELDEDMLPAAIAKELGISKTTVHKYLDLKNSN